MLFLNEMRFISVYRICLKFNTNDFEYIPEWRVEYRFSTRKFFHIWKKTLLLR